MCGLAGIFNVDSDVAVVREQLQVMTQPLRHRGPDDERYLVDGPLGFGFRRLSVIDLAGGAQPISNEDNNIWAIFNGEIYNFRQLRSDLTACGHAFRTSADSEVIVHAYEEFGVDFLTHLDGM